MTNWEKIKEICFRFKELATLGFANIFATAIGAVFWFYLASFVGSEDYGHISYIISIAGIVGVISLIGGTNAIIVYTAKNEKVILPIAVISVSCSIITAIILFFILKSEGSSLYVIGYVIFSLISAEILGRKLYKKYSIYLLTQRFLMVVLGITFYFLLGVEGVVIGISLSFFPFTIKLYQIFKKSSFSFKNLSLKREFLINSYVLDLSRVLSTSTDKIIIAPFFGFVLLGNYQLGVQVLSLLNLIPSIVYQYTLPQDASGITNHKLKKMIIIFSILLATLGVLLSPLIIPHMFPKFDHAVEVIQIMSIATIPTTINFTYISKLLGDLKSRIVIIGSSLFIIVQILCIFILGELYGINGIASSFVIAAFSESIFLVIINRFYLKSNLPHN